MSGMDPSDEDLAALRAELEARIEESQTILSYGRLLGDPQAPDAETVVPFPSKDDANG